MIGVGVVVAFRTSMASMGSMAGGESVIQRLRFRRFYASIRVVLRVYVATFPFPLPPKKPQPGASPQVHGPARSLHRPASGRGPHPPLHDNARLHVPPHPHQPPRPLQLKVTSPLQFPPLPPWVYPCQVSSSNFFVYFSRNREYRAAIRKVMGLKANGVQSLDQTTQGHTAHHHTEHERRHDQHHQQSTL